MTSPSVVAELFADAPQDRYLRWSNFDLDKARAEVDRDGYTIVHDLARPEPREAARSFWLATYGRNGSHYPRVNWSSYLGQSNTVGFSEDSFQCLFRSCDFLWNDALQEDTRHMCVRLNALRNLILGLDPLLGVKFASDRYGIFVTTSYYPAGSGHMAMHVDGVGQGMPLLHHIMPLTFKGQDYSGGGMVVMDRSARRIDVDSQLRPGSVVFYDGALNHGVDRIVAQEGKQLGRLQMFAIPTRFVNAEVNAPFLQQIPIRRFLRAKAIRMVSDARRRLGMVPIDRL
jgi:hypothetical protein